MKISVIIPAHKCDLVFKKALDSILNSNFQDFEIVLVVDGNEKFTVQNETKIPLKIIELNQTYGPAYARNIGVKNASGEILYFSDSDVEIKKDTLLLVKTFFENTDNNCFIGSYDDEPANKSYVSQYKNLSHHFVHQSSGDYVNTFWGACGGIRKEVFEKIGGFNSEKYRRPCIEDIELGYRISEAGYKIKVNKGIQVKHLKRWTLYSFIKTDLLDRAIPWTQLLAENKHYNQSDLNLGILHKVNSIVSVFFLIFLFFGMFKIAVFAWFLFLFVNFRFFGFLSKMSLVFAFVSTFLHMIHYLVAILGFTIGKAKVIFN